MSRGFLFFTVTLLTTFNLFFTLTLPSLPLEHFKFWFRNNEEYKKLVYKLCSEGREEQIKFDTKCSHKFQQICLEVEKSESACWGYEDRSLNCSQNNLFVVPECPKDSFGWARNKVEQRKVFFEQADFGYVRERRKELKMVCKAKSSSGDEPKSSLECSQFFRFCKAENILIDFTRLLKIEEPMRYRDDVIGKDQIGGWNCDLDADLLQSEGAHRSPLQSWYAELENYSVFSHLTAADCDVWLKKPTFLMKLDATVNMYHHFCDFINLYASLHLNNSFFMDNNILIWDTFPYRSNFGLIWQAFTKNPVLDLSTFRGKKVCLKNAVFSLLPRMIYGIFYNMPLIPGCGKTGLFRAFNQHLLHKLGIQQTQTEADEIRITLISRQTKYRRVLNEEELLSALRNKSSNYVITKYDFNHQMPFKDQVSVSANSDILIGMHGAGLTHCLFQPDWAVLFELYNCEDPDCYKDLARLRGVEYLTWQEPTKVYPEDAGHHPELGAHAKFTNYKFDVEEFIRLVEVGVEHVRRERRIGQEDCRTRDEL